MPLAQTAAIKRRTLSGPALRTFFRIADLWQIPVDHQLKLLGSPSRFTFYKWKRQFDGSLPQETLERISYIIGIYKALQILLPDPTDADQWIHQPNQAELFGGQTALDYLLQGDRQRLEQVRRYLDAQRGG